MSEHTDANAPSEQRDALHRVEQQLSLLADFASEYALYTVDESGAIRSWNKGAERMYLHSAANVIAHHHAMLFAPEKGPAGLHDTRLLQAAANGRADFEGWRLRRDGSQFPANNILIALYTIDAQPDGFAQITRDLSTHRGLEDRFRQVVESAPSAMVIVAEDGCIEMVNEQAERMFGYPRAEMLGCSIDMLVPTSFRAHHPSLRKCFLDAPASRPMGAGRDLYALRKDGSEFPVEIGLNPISTDAGTVVLSAIVDISMRKRLEERFKKVVEAAPNAMVMINQAGLIEMVNTQAEVLFGYLRAEMLHMPIEMLVPERFRSAHPALRGRFFSEPRSRAMGAGRDLYGLRKDGSEFPVEIGLNPLETEEGTMVLSAIVDISDRKQKEEKIKASLREKDILLAEIHHRVKNNLQIVNSLLDLQARRIDDPRISVMLRDSRNRVHSMALIHQILYQSKDFSEVDFSSVLERLIPALVASYSVNTGRIDIKINAEKVCLPLNAAIPCGLIVNELVANALKHGFPSGRSGKISTNLRVDADSGEVVLEVSDDGIGLPEQLDVGSAVTLGLELVTMLTRQIEGRLEVNAAAPTRFTITLPRTE